MSDLDTQALEQRAVNAIRALTIDATQEAGSGHPGMPMGAAAWGMCFIATLCSTILKTRTGGTVTVMYSLQGTALCCSTVSCT